MHNIEIKIDFYDEGLPMKQISFLTYLQRFVDSAFKINRSYYPQMLLEEFKHNAENEASIKGKAKYLGWIQRWKWIWKWT